MKHKDRSNAYLAYIREMISSKGELTDEAIKHRKEAFDVTEEDIDEVCSEIANANTLQYQMLMFDILMEDLRDLRDIRQIGANRRSIMRVFTPSDEDILIKDSMFVL